MRGCVAATTANPKPNRSVRGRGTHGPFKPPSASTSNPSKQWKENIGFPDSAASRQVLRRTVRRSPKQSQLRGPSSTPLRALPVIEGFWRMVRKWNWGERLRTEKLRQGLPGWGVVQWWKAGFPGCVFTRRLPSPAQSLQNPSRRRWLGRRGVGVPSTESARRSPTNAGVGRWRGSILHPAPAVLGGTRGRSGPVTGRDAAGLLL